MAPDQSDVNGFLDFGENDLWCDATLPRPPNASRSPQTICDPFLQICGIAASHNCQELSDNSGQEAFEDTVCCGNSLSAAFTCIGKGISNLCSVTAVLSSYLRYYNGSFIYGAVFKRWPFVLVRDQPTALFVLIIEFYSLHRT